MGSRGKKSESDLPELMKKICDGVEIRILICFFLYTLL